eukprot:118784-Amphidinium_carterae.2
MSLEDPRLQKTLDNVKRHMPTTDWQKKDCQMEIYEKNNWNIYWLNIKQSVNELHEPTKLYKLQQDRNVHPSFSSK